MPAKLDRCVMKLMADSDFKPLKGRTKRQSAFAVCTAQLKKGGESLNDIKISFDVPIILNEGLQGESSERFMRKGKKNLTIRGEAVRETISRNNIKYVGEELRKAHETLVGKPILDTHRSGSIKDNLGVVTGSEFDESDQRILFTADIMDSDAIERIEDGRVNSVSIGAGFKEIVKEEVEVDGKKSTTFLVKGLEFHELSLVSVPGVRSATIFQKLNEAFDASKNINENVMEENIMEEKVETETFTKEQVEALIAEKLSEAKESVKEDVSKDVETKLVKTNLLSKLSDLKEEGAKVPEVSEDSSVEVLKAVLETVKANFTKEEADEEEDVEGKVSDNKDEEVTSEEGWNFESFGNVHSLVAKTDVRGNFLK